VLNALQEAEEADIVAGAGHEGAVTVATNMAGRGTDIELCAAARAAGGLHVILTAFHETQRIDRQLFGRAGRQGDPGSSEAITALDDELYRLFAPGPAKLLESWIKEWPIREGPAEWLRRAAQRRGQSGATRRSAARWSSAKNRCAACSPSRALNSAHDHPASTAARLRCPALAGMFAGRAVRRLGFCGGRLAAGGACSATARRLRLRANEWVTPTCSTRNGGCHLRLPRRAGQRGLGQLTALDPRGGQCACKA
jgi:hypothetical protein